MATSFIEFKEKGFWVDDAFFEEASAMLFWHLNQNGHSESWQNEFKDLLKINAEGAFMGFMHWSLDDYFQNLERREWLVENLERLILLIDNKKEFPDISFLDDLLKSTRGDSWMTRGGSREAYEKNLKLTFGTSIKRIYGAVLKILNGERTEDYPGRISDELEEK